MLNKLLSLVRRRKRLLVVAPLLLFLGIGPYLWSRAMSLFRRVQTIETAQIDAPKPASDGGLNSTLRIVAYNIAHGRGATDSNLTERGSEKSARISRIAQFLTEIKADVVVLNEVDFDSTWSGGQNQAEAIAREAGFRYRVEQRNMDFRLIYGSWKSGNAILSKYPISDTELVEYPAFKSWEPWICSAKCGCVCTIRFDGRAIRVVAVHTEVRSESVRVGSVREIARLARASDIPLIAAGDFNSTPAGFPNHRTTPGRRIPGRRSLGSRSNGYVIRRCRLFREDCFSPKRR